MNLRDYIIKRYEKELKQKPTETLRNILTNLFARYIKLEEFKKKFNLEECTYPMILEFVLDPNNAYEIAKYGYECSKTKPDFIDNREISATDSYDYEQRTSTKKFR